MEPTSPLPDHLSTPEKRAESIKRGVAEWVRLHPEQVQPKGE